jgi:hypothetical protein
MSLPDALWMRVEDTPGLDLIGNLHILSPPDDDERLIAVASELADQLTDFAMPPQPGPHYLPLWLDERNDVSSFSVNKASAMLLTARVVSVVMKIDGDGFLFGYQVVDPSLGTELNRILANGMPAESSSLSH